MMRNISECNNEIRDVNRSDNSTNGINENSIQPAKSQSREDQAGEISLYINQALDAYKDDDSATVTECCNKVLAIDPENEEAWKLLALFGGWDAKLYDFDTGYILRTINHALGLTPENEKYDVAADIYTARKRHDAFLPRCQTNACSNDGLETSAGRNSLLNARTNRERSYAV